MKYGSRKKYRKSKRYSRRRSYRRRYKATGTSKLSKMVSRILEARAEKKWISNPLQAGGAPPAVVVAAGAWDAITGFMPIAQGTGRENRIGNKIRVHSCGLRGQVSWDEFNDSPATGYHLKMFECRPLKGQTGVGCAQFAANLGVWFNNANNFARTYVSHKVDNLQAGFYIKRTYTFTQPMIQGGVGGAVLNQIGTQHFKLTNFKKKGWLTEYQNDAQAAPNWMPIYVILNASVVNQATITYESRTVFTDY